MQHVACNYFINNDDPLYIIIIIIIIIVVTTDECYLGGTVALLLQDSGWHGGRNRGYHGNNRGDGDKSREQIGNTAVIGFRISGNTTGNKGHKCDRHTEELSNKTAWRRSKVKPECPESQLRLVLSCLGPRPHSTRCPESLTQLHNCSHNSSFSACGQSLWSLVKPYLTGGYEQKVNKANSLRNWQLHVEKGAGTGWGWGLRHTVWGGNGVKSLSPCHSLLQDHLTMLI